LLRAHARAVADRRQDRSAGRLLRVSARDPAASARGGRARVRHQALDRHAEGRALRRARATRGTRPRDTRVLPPAEITPGTTAVVVRDHFLPDDAPATQYS